MRTPLSRAFGGGIGLAALFSLSACVPSATPKTADTLAPLVLPVPTTPVVTAPAIAGVQTTILDANSAVTLATVATTVPPATAAPNTTIPTSTSTTVNPNTTPSTYTVAAKDTVSGIGRRCGLTPQALADYNSWTDGIAHPIYPGTVVKLPCTPEGAAATPSATTSATTTTVKAASPTTTTVTPGPGGLYTVVAGDYLAGIAAKTGTTVKAIVSVNGWSDGAAHPIYPGNVIKLPAKSN
jgi:LysM repeat protein